MDNGGKKFKSTQFGKRIQKKYIIKKPSGVLRPHQRMASRFYQCLSVYCLMLFLKRMRVLFPQLLQASYKDVHPLSPHP